MLIPALSHSRILECSDLAIINGSCDPFASVTMIYTNKKQETKRTKAKKKTISPHFDEVFLFEVKLECFFRVRIVYPEIMDKKAPTYIPLYEQFLILSDIYILHPHTVA